jgi:hypothetical protein
VGHGDAGLPGRQFPRALERVERSLP